MITSNANAILMKEINTHTVRSALKAERRATKQKLAQMTGLSTVTIGSILMELVQQGEAYEDDLIPSKGGRPARLYRYNGEYGQAIVMYAHEAHGIDTVFIRIINLFGESVYQEQVNCSEIQLHSFNEMIERQLEQFASIKAIGFGLPGEEYDGKMIVHDYPALNGTRFSQHYRNNYNLPVAFENDVNAAVVGYCMRHEQQSEAAIVYIYFPQKYPPGLGIYFNGSLYKGFRHFAGEIQSLPIGIDWNALDYTSFDETCAAITNLLVSVLCLLDPEKIILSGHFLNEKHLQSISMGCQQRIAGAHRHNILLSNDFHLDFETGIIASTLNLLEPKWRFDTNS